MKINNNYLTPEIEVVEIAVERGFEASLQEAGFDGPTYTEESIGW